MTSHTLAHRLTAMAIAPHAAKATTPASLDLIVDAAAALAVDLLALGRHAPEYAAAVYLDLINARAAFLGTSIQQQDDDMARLARAITTKLPIAPTEVFPCQISSTPAATS